MVQGELPLLENEEKAINGYFSIANRDGKIYYFCGLNPVFFHDEDDTKSLNMFTAQLVCQGSCKQSEIIKAFKMSKSKISRNVKKYTDHGIEAFFATRKGRGGSVMTPDVIAKAQELLNLGESKNDVAEELGIKKDTLRKAIQVGKLSAPKKNN